MAKLTKAQLEAHWKKIGYDIPDDEGIKSLHKGYYKLINSKITGLSQILAACFVTTKDRNGFSMGIFLACPDCFAYAAAYPEQEVGVFELFPYERITSFATIVSDDKKPMAITMNIYDKDVKILGYQHQIPEAFIERLQEIGVLKVEK